MADSPITSLPSIWNELLRNAPGHAILAGLYLWFVVYQEPAREEQHRAEMAAQRTEFITELREQSVASQARVSAIEEKCWRAIEDNNRLLREILQRTSRPDGR